MAPERAKKSRKKILMAYTHHNNAMTSACDILITTGVVIQEWLGVSMYTDNFLSHTKLSYLSTEKFLDKTRCSSEKAIFNVFVCQVL